VISIVGLLRRLGVVLGTSSNLQHRSIAAARMQTTAKPSPSGTCRLAWKFIADPDGHINHTLIRCVVRRYRPRPPPQPPPCISPAQRLSSKVARWSCTWNSRIHCVGFCVDSSSWLRLRRIHHCCETYRK